MNSLHSQTYSNPGSCYKLPTFKGWLALSNLNEREHQIINELHFVISSNMESVVMLSEKIYEECLFNKIDKDFSAMLRLALVEALNNVVEHAFEGEKNHEIDVYVTFFYKKIRIRITDNGYPNHNGVKPVKQDINPEDIMNIPEGGYGLHIIHQLMDEVNYYRKNNINFLILEKNF